MRCYQCPKPAFYHVADEEIPLCLDCWHKWQHGAYMQFLQNAAMMNQAADDMDMITGLGRMGGRIPVAELAKAMQKGSVQNNIRITNSTVGVINTGDLARIDAVITLTKDTDVEQVGTAIKAVMEATINAQDIEVATKKEIVELVQSLAEQIVGSQGSRKPSVIMTLVRAIEERAKGVVAISTVAHTLYELVVKIFGIG